MKSAMLAHDLIAGGSQDVMVAGGFESMTNIPYMVPKAREGMRMGHGQFQDAMLHRILDYNAQLKKAREKIQQLSNRDPLTGALNRSGFRAHVERAMERSERYGFHTALLYINIDQFAHINDQYGEGAGVVGTTRT